MMFSFMKATLPFSCFLAVAMQPASGQVIERVSVNSAGAQGNSSSSLPSISSDGRFVAFDRLHEED